MRIGKMIVGDWGGMKAGFTVITEEGIEIDNFKIVERNGSLYVRLPDKKGKDDKYYKTVRMPREIEDKIQEQALEAYYQECPDRRPQKPDNDAPF